MNGVGKLYFRYGTMGSAKTAMLSRVCVVMASCSVSILPDSMSTSIWASLYLPT